MTPAEAFRKDTDKRNRLAEFLSDPVLNEALAVINEVPTDVILGLSPTDIALLLGGIQSTARFVSKLLELTTALPRTNEQPKETFGTDHTVDQFDANTP